jgi:hypothetical protein
MSIWYKWLRRLVGKVTPAARRNHPRTPTRWRARLLIETLESRTTPDVTITSWTLPPAGTYKLGDVLNFTANLSFTGADTNVTVNTASGTPSLTIQLDSGTVNVPYAGPIGTGVPTLLFRYTVGLGDLDSDGTINLVSPIQLNGGTITPDGGGTFDPSFTAVATSGTVVDGVPPSITSVTVPSDGTYGIGATLNFTITYSENVLVSGGTPRLTLDIGGTTRFANYVSGSGSNILTFSYTVQAGDNDTNGIGLVGGIDLNGATIRDAAGNDAATAFTSPPTGGILVDGIVPTIVSITPPANGTYKTGDNLDFQFTFSEPVVVDTANGTPQVQLTVGSTTVYATYLTGTGTPTLTFRYTVQAGHLDTDGITVASPIQLNGGTIKDNAGNDADLNFTVWPMPGVQVDGVAPNINNVGKPADGTYPANKRLDFRIFFDQPVNVSGGTPSLLIRVGNQLREARYLWGSGGNYLVFGYRLQPGEVDNDGIEVLNVIMLNGATIRDAAGNDADLSFTPPDTAGIKVDAVLPRIEEIQVPQNGSYTKDQELNFTVRFSKPVFVNFTNGHKPFLRLLIGGRVRKAEYVSGSGTNQLVFRYVVQEEDQDIDGINILTPLARPRNTVQSSIRDSVGNQILADFTPPITTGIRIRVRNGDES